MPRGCKCLFRTMLETRHDKNGAPGKDENNLRFTYHEKVIKNGLALTYRAPTDDTVSRVSGACCLLNRNFQQASRKSHSVCSS